MPSLHLPTKVLPFASFLFREDLLDKSDFLAPFIERFGMGDEIAHDYCPMKEYYSKEMGDINQLSRFFYFCDDITDRTFLVDAKKWGGKLEDELSENNKRKVNIDIGFIALEQVVLATGKPYSHRLHLRDGIYAELTYIYVAGSFGTLPWTYPDYSHQNILGLFEKARKKLKKSMT